MNTESKTDNRRPITERQKQKIISVCWFFIFGLRSSDFGFRSLIISLSCLYAFVPIVYAESAGTSAGAFLKIGAGAKHAALANASGGIADDATATYWNPAGLVQLKHGNLQVMHTLWLEDTSFEFVAVALPVRRAVMGVNIGYLRYGSIPGRDNQDNRIENFTANSKYGSVCLGYPLSSNLSFGVSAKKVMEKIETAKTGVFLLDLGALYKTENIKLGLAVKNMGRKLSFVKEEFAPPVETRFSLAGSLWRDQINLYADIASSNETGKDLGIGAEFNFFEMFIMRAGWRTGRAEDFKKLGGLTLGFGAVVNPQDMGWTAKSEFSYAFVPYGDLGATHRISLSIPFRTTPSVTPDKNNRSFDNYIFN